MVSSYDAGGDLTSTDVDSATLSIAEEGQRRSEVIVRRRLAVFFLRRQESAPCN
jgi:hypothetical protein